MFFSLEKTIVIHIKESFPSTIEGLSLLISVIILMGGIVLVVEQLYLALQDTQSYVPTSVHRARKSTTQNIIKKALATMERQLNGYMMHHLFVDIDALVNLDTCSMDIAVYNKISSFKRTCCSTGAGHDVILWSANGMMYTNSLSSFYILHTNKDIQYAIIVPQDWSMVGRNDTVISSRPMDAIHLRGGIKRFYTTKMLHHQYRAEVLGTISTKDLPRATVRTT